MTSETKPESTIQSVSISKRTAPVDQSAPSLKSPSLGEPRLWLGAKSPFGLALPDAQPSSSTMYAPRGVWLDDEQLVVCDSGNHRILIWKSVPTSDQTPADVVLGQPNFEFEGPSARGRGPENGLHLPTGVIVVDGKLVVGDAWHHRVLVWNQIPTKSDTPPDYVIGQSSLSEVETNRGGEPSLSGMYWPYGIAWINNRFYVSDTGNRRVLVWDGFPDSDRPADRMFGQSHESDSEENRGGSVAADSFRWPHDFAGYKDQLYVADAGNHRVMCWNEHPDSDGPAQSLVGQKGEDVLAVADTANNRILFWRVPLSDQCYGPAFDVVGQVDFSGAGENHWQSVNDATLCWPYGICFHDGTLAIADSGNNRVMLWDCQKILEYAKSLPRLPA